MDPDFLSGVLLKNAPIRAENPGLDELAPAIINHFGVKVPELMKGRNLAAG